MICPTRQFRARLPSVSLRAFGRPPLVVVPFAAILGAALTLVAACGQPVVSDGGIQPDLPLLALGDGAALDVGDTPTAPYLGDAGPADVGPADTGDGDADPDGAHDAVVPGEVPPVLGEWTSAAGHGVLYHRADQTGVRCGNQACDSCCVPATVDPPWCVASDAGGSCAGSLLVCDSTLDCPGATVCCATGVKVSTVVGTTCLAADSCAAHGGRVACATTEDCPAGQACVEGPTMAGRVGWGLCQSGPASLCDGKTGAGCQDADLSKVDWTGRQATDWNLSGANLRQADLTKAVLSRARLVATDLRDSQLMHVLLDHADLSYADLRGAWVQHVTADYAIVDGTQLQVDGGEISLRHAQLSGVWFSDWLLVHWDFSFATLSGVGFAAATLDHVSFKGAALDDVDFTSTEFVSVTCQDGKSGTEHGCHWQ